MIPCKNKIKQSYNTKFQNNCKKHNVITAKLSDPKLSGAFLNSLNSSFKIKNEGRVTAVVVTARHQKATKNQTQQRFEHSARSRSSNTAIKVLLDSGSDGDLMFHEKGAPMHFP